jgi:hypothetical protein
MTKMYHFNIQELDILLEIRNWILEIFKGAIAQNSRETRECEELLFL